MTKGGQMNTDSRQGVNFDEGYESLLLLLKDAATIDEFVEVYQMLLKDLQERRVAAKSAESLQENRVKTKKLKALLMKQMAFVSALKDEAFINEFESLAEADGSGDGKV